MPPIWGFATRENLGTQEEEQEEERIGPTTTTPQATTEKRETPPGNKKKPTLCKLERGGVAQGDSLYFLLGVIRPTRL